MTAIMAALEEGGHRRPRPYKSNDDIDQKWEGCCGEMAEPGEHVDDAVTDEQEPTGDGD